MIFKGTKLKGVYIIELETLEDERGFFARSFCEKEFEEHGLNPRIVQCDISYNKKRGTLRGMHYQAPPHQETKLVACTRGAIYDVVLDLRKDSPTCNQWLAVELSAGNYKILYIPEGVAHGFQTLEDNSLVYYQISEFYYPECARGVRWDSPVFDIEWPLPNPILSDKDRSYQDSCERK